MADPHATERELFAARLKPHRSLSRENFRTLLLFIMAFSTITTLPFLLMGAWPVVGFMGLDIALLYLAFRINFRDARAYEEVRVTPIDVELAKVSAKGARAEWHFNPLWVRLDREEHEEFGTQKLSLVSHGRRVGIADFLGPDDKAVFATQLTGALAEARRGPRFS